MPSPARRPIRHKLLIIIAILVPFFFTSLLTAVHVIRVVWLNLLLHPFLVQRRKSKKTPKDLGMSHENIVIQTAEGLHLSGWFIPASKKSSRTLILCHGVNRSKEFFLPVAKFLHAAGYNLIMFDMRTHGHSEGERISFGYDEQYDIDAVIDYLKKRDRHLTKELGIIAHSMGAASAIFAATRRHEIRAMVLICCFADIEWNMTYWITRLGHLPYWPFVPIALKSFRKELHPDLKQVSPIYYLDKIKIPLFFIHSQKDGVTDPISSQQLYDKALDPKELWFVPNAEHETFYTVAPGEFEQRVKEFLSRAL